MRFKVGQIAEFSKTISEFDVYAFAGICGDFNPCHVNEIAAQKGIFGKRVVHGALINAFISTVLGMYLPGEGTIYLSQNSRFLKPVFIGDTITAKVTILEIDEKKHAKLSTIVSTSDGKTVLEGEAVVLLPTGDSIA